MTRIPKDPFGHPIPTFQKDFATPLSEFPSPLVQKVEKFRWPLTRTSSGVLVGILVLTFAGILTVYSRTQSGPEPIPVSTPVVAPQPDAPRVVTTASYTEKGEEFPVTHKAVIWCINGRQIAEFTGGVIEVGTCGGK